MSVEEIRSRIGEIDEQISRLVEERLSLSKSCQSQKKTAFSADREAYLKGLYQQKDVIDTILTLSKTQSATMKGSEDWLMVCGPCAVDNQESIRETAKILSANGIKDLRAGCWKPRTNPYEWQGLGAKGLWLLREAADEYNMKVWTEIRDLDNLNYSDLIDVPWIGARNGQNFDLIARTAKKFGVLALKRGPWMSVEEWLCAAEYALKEGAEVILVERGIKGSDKMFRNTLDLVGAMMAKALSSYRVLIDVSHSTGIANLALPLIPVVKAAGLDGVMIESRWHPKESKTDAFQAVDPSLLKFNG